MYLLAFIALEILSDNNYYINIHPPPPPKKKVIINKIKYAECRQNIFLWGFGNNLFWEQQ